MGVLTKEQLNQVWDAGLKYRIGRFRTWLVERGLNTFVTPEKIQTHFYEVLYNFFVIGVEETKDGRQSIPSRSAEHVTDTEGKDR